MTNSKENLSRSGIIDARARYRAAARLLRNTALVHGHAVLSGATSSEVFQTW